VTTLGDTQALPRVIDVDPGEPAGVPVPVQLPAARPAPVTAAPPTEALRLRPVISVVPAGPGTDEFASPADEPLDVPGATAVEVELGEVGDEAPEPGSPSLVAVPHEQIYEEAMASLAALAQNWSEAVDDLYGGGTHRSAA
jgi:hypothetical protein